MLRIRCSVLLAFALVFCEVLTAAEPLTLDVWPGTPPGPVGETGPEVYQPQRPGEKEVARLTNVSKPTIAVYQPSAEKRTQAAVIVCPGGGYRILAMDLEGTEVAEWLNSIGVTAVVLKYRVPVPDAGNARKGVPEGPLQDVQRAIRLVRSKAETWQIDPEKIGVLGFSAGGNLAGAACLMHDRPRYEPIDDVDRLNARPNFGVLIYPAYFVDEVGKLKPEFQPSDQTPPLFFAHAADDRVKADNSIALFQAVRQAGVAAELHIYAAGGHGFGLRPSEFPASSWPQRCEAWFVQQKLIVPRPAPVPESK